MIKIGDQARGKWPNILPALGIDKRFLVNKHGPCPMCEGKDRFRFDDKDGRGSYYCSQCGAGDGIELVKRALKVDFKGACREIEKHLGVAPVAIRNGPPAEKVVAEMKDIWRRSKPIGDVQATQRWWMARVGSVPDFPDLRGIDALALPGAGVHAAMLAKFRDEGGETVNMHRTFLAENGAKASIDEPRRVMPLPLPKGGAVRLSPVDTALGIAEGIETAVAASILHGLGCWAALNALNLEWWSPPPSVAWVRIFGDNDKSGTGQAAAWSLAKRLRIKGLVATVELPPNEGEDWNDVLLQRADAA